MTRFRLGPSRSTLADGIAASRGLYQALAVLLIAKTFAKSDFGVYSFITAGVAVVTPLAMTGLDLAATKASAGRPASSALLGRLLGANLILTTLASLGVALFLYWKTSLPAGVLLLFALGECFAIISAQHVYRQLVADGRTVTAAVQLSLPATWKLAWAGGLNVLTPAPQLSDALFTYSMGAVAISLLQAALLMHSARQRERSHQYRLGSVLLEGMGFASALTVRSLMIEAPKFILAWTGNYTGVADYALASRLSQLGLMPLQAYLGNRLPALVRRENLGSLARGALASAVLGASGTASAGLALPLVLQASYGTAVAVTLVLALSVIPQSASTFLLDLISFGVGPRLRLVTATVGLMVVVSSALVMQLLFGSALAAAAGFASASSIFSLVALYVWRKYR
jgi:O-antigen/teichoic acid export membrane protein